MAKSTKNVYAAADKALSSMKVVPIAAGEPTAEKVPTVSVKGGRFTGIRLDNITNKETYRKAVANMFKRVAAAVGTDHAVTLTVKGKVPNINVIRGMTANLKGTYNVIGSIGRTGRNGFTALVLRTEGGRAQYLLSWRNENIANIVFNVNGKVPSLPTLLYRQGKSEKVIKDTLSVKGETEYAVSHVRDITRKNRGKLPSMGV